MTAAQYIPSLISAIGNDLDAHMMFVSDNLRGEMKMQGHVNSGRTNATINYSIVLSLNQATATLYGSEVLGYLQRGTRHTRITGAQIAGLYSWWRIKGLDPKNARRAAWATAYSQVRHGGSPTPKSYAFTQNGRRKNGITEAVDKYDNLIKTPKFDHAFSLVITDVLKRT